MCSAPPPRPEVLAQVVLVCDPPQAGVNLSIDAVRDLAFPTNSFLGCGAFGQVRQPEEMEGGSSEIPHARQPDAPKLQVRWSLHTRQQLSTMYTCCLFCPRARRFTALSTWAATQWQSRC